MRRQATAPSRVLVIISTIVVALLLLFASGAFARSALGADARDAAVVRVPVIHQYEVKSGDSLWAIAQEMRPAGVDVRATIEQIKALNGLSSSSLSLGQILVLPLG